MRPSIYILRKNTDPIPARDTCSPGDIVVLPSGDVLVYTASMWDLLPGRYISIDELKEFVSYISSGWPDTPSDARADLEGRLPEQFLSRMLGTVEKIASSASPGEA
jgi:hypothetical protein